MIASTSFALLLSATAALASHELRGRHPVFAKRRESSRLQMRDSYSNKEFTWYGTNTGADACTGKDHSDSDYYVAMGYDQFGDGGCCGKRMQLDYKGKSIVVECVDECASCPQYGQLDLTKSVFEYLVGDLGTGEVFASWSYVDNNAKLGPVSGGSKATTTSTKKATTTSTKKSSTSTKKATSTSTEEDEKTSTAHPVTTTHTTTAPAETTTHTHKSSTSTTADAPGNTSSDDNSDDGDDDEDCDEEDEDDNGDDDEECDADDSGDDDDSEPTTTHKAVVATPTTTHTPTSTKAPAKPTSTKDDEPTSTEDDDEPSSTEDDDEPSSTEDKTTSKASTSTVKSTSSSVTTTDNGVANAGVNPTTTLTAEESTDTNSDSDSDTTGPAGALSGSNAAALHRANPLFVAAAAMALAALAL